MLLTDWYDVLTGKAYLPLSRQDCSLEVSDMNIAAVRTKDKF